MDLRAGGRASGCDTSRRPPRRRSSEDLHAAEHAPLAARTQAETGGQQGEVHLAGFRVHGIGTGGDLGLAERSAAGGEESRAASMGEEAIVADADEALGEDVEEEATRELLKGERERSSPSAAVVLEAEGDGPVVDVEQPVVRDRDAVSVAGEVRQDVLGAVEGRYTVCLLFADAIIPE